MNTSKDQLAPADWFDKVTVDVANQTQPWPWYNLTMAQWLEFLPGQARMDQFITWMVNLERVGWGIGFVGNVLICITVISKSKMLRNEFYISLLVVAMFDLIFDLLKFSRWLVQKLCPTCKVGILFYNYASGVAYSCSLMSDMITLALTIERYLALAAPIFHKNLTPTKKRMAWGVALLVSAMTACTRMHYSFDTVAFSSADTRKQLWFRAVSYFSDNVVPFLLTAVTLFLVAGIAKVLHKRKAQRKTRVKPDSQDPKAIQEQARLRRQERDMAKTMSLLAALLIMYFMNQLGYMLYATGVLLTAEQNLTYWSTYEEITIYSMVNDFYLIANYISSPMEVYSRSLVFYIYILFSQSFRNDFLRATARCGPCKQMQPATTTMVMSVSGMTRGQASTSRMIVTKHQ